MDNQATKILLVEGEAETSRLILQALKADNYAVQQADGGKTAIKLSSAFQPDLVLLSLGLPDAPPREMMAQFRSKSRLPVLLLTRKEQEAEKVEALEAGADDYLEKPLFGTQELLERVRIALRNASRGETVAFACQDLAVDLRRRRVSLHAKNVHLTPTEYSLLERLIYKAGQVVTHAELLREVWGKAEGYDHYLRIYVQRLRRKLGDDPFRPRYIFTESGVGYRLNSEG